MVRVPGSHAPNAKNRSSKHLIKFTKCKPAVRSMSNAALAEYNTSEARKELKRRNEKRAKKEAKAK